MTDTARITACWNDIKAAAVPDLRALFRDEPERLAGHVLEEGGLRFDFSKTHLTAASLSAF